MEEYITNVYGPHENLKCQFLKAYARQKENAVSERPCSGSQFYTNPLTSSGESEVTQVGECPFDFMEICNCTIL